MPSLPRIGDIELLEDASGYILDALRRRGCEWLNDAVEPIVRGLRRVRGWFARHVAQTLEAIVDVCLDAEAREDAEMLEKVAEAAAACGELGARIVEGRDLDGFDEACREVVVEMLWGGYG